jgi:hypothetical protein
MGSIPIARSTLWQHQATQGDRIGVNALIRWEGLGNQTPKGRRERQVAGLDPPLSSVTVAVGRPTQ